MTPKETSKKLASLFKRGAIGLIRFYQIVFSPDKGIFRAARPICRFCPTCSQYCLQAIDKFGILKGGLLGIKRILKCHPFNPGGWDPLPENRKPQ